MAQPFARPTKVKKPVEPLYSKKLLELTDRTRMIEEKLSQLREKVRVIDENMLMKTNELKEDVKELNLQVNELRKSIDEIKETLIRIVKEVESSAKISDIKVLEKYINAFDPTRFLTKEDVINIVKKELEGRS